MVFFFPLYMGTFLLISLFCFFHLFFFWIYKMLFLFSDVLYDFSCQGAISSCVGIRGVLWDEETGLLLIEGMKKGRSMFKTSIQPL